jgi:hypothetical protein
MFVVERGVCGLINTMREHCILTKDAKTHINHYPSGNKSITISPDIVGDFTNIKQPNKSFYLVVFDPPHIKRNALGEITKRYGNLEGDWKI